MHRLKKFASEWPVVWLFTKIGVTTIPSALIAYVAIRWSQKPLPWQDSIRTWLESHLFFTVFCILSPLVLPQVFTLIDRAVAKEQEKSADILDRAISTSLLIGLNNLVGMKLRRFTEYARRMSGSETKGQVFEAITQPERQITASLNVLQHLFQRTEVDNSFQLVLVRIINNLPVDFVDRLPNDIQLSPSLISSDASKTMFHHCAKDNRIIVIPNIAAHLKKRRKNRLYHPTGNPDSDRGSIMCYPFFCEATGQVEFVLSIKSANINVVSEQFKRNYKQPIDSVVTRVLLEHNLALIKRKSQ